MERLPEDARGAAHRTWSSCSPRPRRTRCRPRSSTAATASTSAGPRSSRSPACCAGWPREEEIELPDPAVGMLARAATGSFRDALGTLEQLVTYGGNAGQARGRPGHPRRGRRRAGARQPPSRSSSTTRAPRCSPYSGCRTRGATSPSSCATCRPTCATCSWSRRWARCRTRSRSPPSTPTALRSRQSASHRARSCARSTSWPRRSPP